MAIDPKHFITIPRDQVPTAIKKAYELSQPVGLGFLHFKEGGLGDENVAAILGQFEDRPSYPVIASMDYVHGRCCKLTIQKHPSDDKLALLPAQWYDHTDIDLIELLTACGVEEPAAAVLEAREAWRIHMESLDV